MASSVIVFSLLYWLCVSLFIIGPAEFRSAGFTVENLFSSWIGTEDFDFINFHIKRISATVVVHGFFPMGYFLGMTFVSESGVTVHDMFNFSLELGWHVYANISLLVLLAALSIVFYWQISDWSNHPIVRDLELYRSTNNTSESAWRVRASEIGNEFRRIDKYATTCVGWTRVVSTENWILVTSLYKVHIARQDKVTLAIMESEEHDISPESSSMVQYLRLRIKPTIRRDIKPYYARILSTEYRELKDSLSTVIVALPNITIMQSIDELFLKAFREQVSKNRTFASIDGIEQCMGCMQIPAEVKLVKNCDSSGQDECRSCECRPMWCVDCMGRWYASRQDRARPNSWLSGSASCPMCRAKFCMLDISPLDIRET